MVGSRKDMTSWVMHFIHDRNYANDPAYNINEGEETPFFPFQEDQPPSRFEQWEWADNDYGLEPDADAFSVLLKIISDGHIRSGWSFRNDRPTIYGPRSACCFTEMPLYGLIEYAKQRSKEYVGAYAIGLLKQEFFAAGGRPVIYGLSGPHKEISKPLPSPPHYLWPRKLDPSCGISEREQYRYVAMNLDSKRPIDWSHEREWRWADSDGACSCPGLPLWLKGELVEFSQTMIVVPSDREAHRILDLLKELHDAGSHNYGHEYRRKTLLGTHIVSLEQLASISPTIDAANLRLEDLPSSSLKTFEQPEATPELIAKVKSALAEAHTAAEAAVDSFLLTARYVEGGKFVADVCGWADLVIYDSQSSVVSALIALGETTIIGGVGYRVSDFGRHGRRKDQALSVAEAGVEAAKHVMEKRFPDVGFGVRTMWD
ncbi:hypothetical protein XI00_04415 [Bradyrhizobium sp. CCBAU 21359]|uniref:hypothetical protein n=1 Tax=Bradyrhizobium sp. CCBAU 21359 TaxID=1325080 RepID=UPI002306019C|nr:hypothetical protein [Bradyrhizobium sp. CCBAU 21359]MDA9453544.1 hypothetical protein [Bradyrhizobium sp. CCBAU 21359]